MSDLDQIKEKIKKAEESVSGMQNEALRKSAFEIILSNLLIADSDQRSRQGSHKGPDLQTNPVNRIRKVKVATKKGTSQGKEVKKTDIALTPEQLQELKIYYETHKPEGEERSVFILACFIDEKLSKKQFHEGDVNHIYQNLLPLKPVVRPPALDQEKVKRSLVWLTSPSRKKMWLQANENGTYEISSQGRLHITYGPSNSENKK